MIRKNNETTYELTANEGFEMVAHIDGIEVARAKTVIIPNEGTLLEWIEAVEKPPEPVPTESNADKIAQLKLEIERLETEGR